MWALVLATLIPSLFAQTGIDRCGQTPVRPNLEDRIVGGREAVPYSWPWQVVFCTNGWHDGCSLECGGSVVSEKWIVTAGHCVYGDTESPGMFRVKTGVYDEAATNETGEVVLRVKQIHLHPKYNPKPDPTWDIALLELADKVVFSEHVQPVCFASKDEQIVKEPKGAWVTGWGTTTEGGNISKKLKQVFVPFVNSDTCQRDYHSGLDPQTMICAGEPGKDTCQGDSGGPLVVATGQTWFLYGLTSWGYGCAEKNHPGVYSRTTTYCDWIAETTNNELTCKDPSSY